MIPGSVSVGILAGVVSGIFYLVVRYVGKLRSSLREDTGCARCSCAPSHRKCSACSAHREVKLQAGDWFYRQLQGRFCKNHNNNNTGADNGAAMDPDSAQVREFIERLVEALVSGQLDNVKVNRLYSHSEYDRMFSCHHSALCEMLVRLSFALQMSLANKPLTDQDSPSAVHTTLKQRVEHIIEEAMTLPNLKSEDKNNGPSHRWDEDMTSLSYEDILATAILNKVIERFQERTGLMLCDGNTGQDIEPSSLDDAEGLSPTGPLSMTIEECIEEEVTTYGEEAEEEEDSKPASELDFYLSGLNLIKQRRVPFPELGADIVDDEEEDESESPQPTDVFSPVDSWEENWLFQRRRLKVGGSTQAGPMPVPMLVPNPSEDYRALIGGRDAEEVSDLSDCSEGALEDVVLAGVAEEHLPASTELTKAASVESLPEFGQKDSEYTEAYVPVPKPRTTLVQQEPELSAPPRPGTIAEREHLKWQSAVPLPNNPYSPENISKRLSKTTDLFSCRTVKESAAPLLQVECEPDLKKYGRDYYINESRRPTGGIPPQKCADTVDAEQDSGVDTSDTSQFYGHVENEVSRWQKGINQTEQRWLSKLKCDDSNKPTAREWHTAPSECSTVSSDLDLDADVPIVLPSVKELAKHFSGGATSDSDTPVRKPTPKSRRRPETVEPPRPVVIVEKREIHSLTARSISREFREGLRRNLPNRLDRNVHNNQDSVSSSPEPVNGYTSDESGARSPTPPVGGTLRSNIAFWEQMSAK